MSSLSDLRKTFLPMYCQNRPNIHKFVSVMSSDAIPINLKLLAIFVWHLKNLLCIFDLFLSLNSIPSSATM